MRSPERSKECFRSSSLQKSTSSAVFVGCLVWIALLRSCHSSSIGLRSASSCDKPLSWKKYPDITAATNSHIYPYPALWMFTMHNKTIKIYYCLNVICLSSGAYCHNWVEGQIIINNDQFMQKSWSIYIWFNVILWLYKGKKETVTIFQRRYFVMVTKCLSKHVHFYIIVLN